jgi:hypothetical protein
MVRRTSYDVFLCSGYDHWKNSSKYAAKHFHCWKNTKHRLQSKMEHRLITTTLFVMHEMNHFQGNGWRRRAESLRLTSHDFILWACVNTMGVLGRWPTLMNKNTRITVVTAGTVTLGMPRSVWAKLSYRLDICLATRVAHEDIYWQKHFS